MTTDLLARDTEWGPHSLAALLERLAMTCPADSRMRCVNPACRAVRKRRGGTGRPTGASGYCRACWDRWRKAGFPPEGPPVAMTRSQFSALGNAAMRAAMAPAVIAAPGPIRPAKPKLSSRDYGYLPSSGTARREDMASAA